MCAWIILLYARYFRASAYRCLSYSMPNRTVEVSRSCDDGCVIFVILSTRNQRLCCKQTSRRWVQLLRRVFKSCCYTTAQESKRIVATLGQSVDLTCVTTSEQKAVWYRDEVPLSDKAGRLTTTQDTLTIMDTTLRDSGRYTCIDPAQTPTVLFSKDYSLVVERK